MKLFYFLIISLFISNVLQSQSFQTDERVWNSATQRAFSDLGRAKLTKPALGNIIGSEYYETEFKEGEIVHLDKKAYTNLKTNVLDKCKQIYEKTAIIGVVQMNSIKLFVLLFITLWLISPYISMLNEKDKNGKNRPNMFKILIASVIVTLLYISLEGVNLLINLYNIILPS